MSDPTRPHKWPGNVAGDVVAWRCAACGTWVNEYGPREPDDCPVDWRNE